MRIVITLALLFSFAFSSVHEFVFAMYDNNHCNITEYVGEFDSPTGDHGDICDTHFEYHHAFILPSLTRVSYIKKTPTKPHLYKENYSFLADLDYPKPPIS